MNGKVFPFEAINSFNIDLRRADPKEREPILTVTFTLTSMKQVEEAAPVLMEAVRDRLKALQDGL